MQFRTFASLALAATSAIATAAVLPGSTGDTPEDRAAAVKEAYLHSWNGYKEFAWGDDELLSVSNKGGNSRNGWGASIADGLTTAILMELDEVVLEQLKFLAKVDFTKTSTTVSLFETSIRYIGGMISGYDLLKGPYASLAPKGNSSLVDSLLKQATILADRLSFAFDTHSGVPFNNLNFSTNSPAADPTNRPTNSSADPTDGLTNGLATIGTLVLEWTHLSDLTGNPKYSKLVSRAESHLLDPEPSSGQPFPGLLGSNVAVSTGLFTNSAGGWSGGTDSFYEYLLKMYIYDSSNTKYRDRWLTAVESTMKNLIQNPTHNAKSDFVAEYNARSLSLNEGHLTCFIGGNFVLGGQLLKRNDIVNAGLKLASGCHETYTSTASGIGPERWSWSQSGIPSDQSAFEEKNGWYVTVPSYDLRPEVVESFYHAYKLTGQSQYADWAWNAFKAINASCRTGSGYSSIDDVTQKNGGSQTDLQESFWFAEVLKYLYLTFAEDVTVGVEGGGWVFNTEAHPFKTKG